MDQDAHPEIAHQLDANLAPALSADRVWNAVTVTRNGRVFVGFPSADGPGIQVAEAMPDGRLEPYPDAGWNRVGDDADGRFVLVNALRIGPDGRLWIVDSGADRLIVVDVDNDTVARGYDLSPATGECSFLDDVRFHGPLAYLTDAGVPGLVVLDLDSGQVRRVLDGHPALTDQRPMIADGRVLRRPDGTEARIHADQLEVSPDGEYLFVQPASGPMSRIETRWLDDPSVPPDVLAGNVEHWVDTPTTGGTAMERDGTIYLSDVERRRILRIDPSRYVDTLVEDARLAWADAMWLDEGGQLWIPVPQLHRTEDLSGGEQTVEYPVWIYTLPLALLA